MIHIPVILLISNNDNGSYLAHADCGVDKLEPRAINICRLKMDIQILINKHERIMKLLEKNLSDNLPSPTAKSEEDALFINKVNKLLEKNLSTESYTVDMLVPIWDVSYQILHQNKRNYRQDTYRIHALFQNE